MDILLEPKKISKFFVLVVIGLTLAQIAGQLLGFFLGPRPLTSIVKLFNFEEEQNFPAMYASLALLFCSGLLTLIAYAKRKSGDSYSLQWAGLAVIFLFLSIDEMLEIHELISKLLRPSLDTSNFIYFVSWMIPYGIAGIVFLWIYVKFLFHLPGKTRTLFIVAGVIFIIGAVGLEVVAAIHNYLYDWTRKKSLVDMTYAAIVTVKELLEMVGVVVFIYALTSYIASELKELRLKITSSPENVLTSSNQPVASTNMVEGIIK